MRFLGLYILLALCGSSIAGCEKKLDEHAVADSTVPTVGLIVDNTIPDEYKIPLLIAQTGPGALDTITGKIERRGGYSIGFPKHSYEIDLEEDVSLAGLPADDDWILNANYIDKTFLRHVISYELFREMHPDNRAPRCAYVEVELNGNYQGLYVLMEKLDRSTLEVQKGDPAAVIFKEPLLFRPNYSSIEPERPGNLHHQTYPKIKDKDRNSLIDSLHRLLTQTSDDRIFAEVQKHFDLRNLVDWHLLLLITNNQDGLLKNFYLYRTDSTTPLRIAPWDYDHSFGRDGDGERNLNERTLDGRRSLLFSRLLDDWRYINLLKRRWQELNRTGLLSVGGLTERVQSKAARLNGLTAKNFARWPTSGKWYYDDNGFEQELQLLIDFIPIRHAYVNDYLNQL